jgi:predicted AAA+ superfamily ATPase
MLQHGYLPPFYDANFPQSLQSAYAGDYLREEVAAEGLVRRLPSFSEFLRLAALSDTEFVNFTSIARDVGVASQTIKDYYQILVDTLIGYWLPPYRKSTKRRMRAADKFYFSDVGVVNFFAKRHTLAVNIVMGEVGVAEHRSRFYQQTPIIRNPAPIMAGKS